MTLSISGPSWTIDALTTIDLAFLGFADLWSTGSWPVTGLRRTLLRLLVSAYALIAGCVRTVQWLLEIESPEMIEPWLGTATLLAIRCMSMTKPLQAGEAWPALGLRQPVLETKLAVMALIVQGSA